MWQKYNPQELATPQAFQQNPRLVWEWYTWRRELVAKAQPNPGHLALVEMERRFPQFTLITQNVDGMHQRAGNTNVIELHGNLNRNKRFDDHVIVETWDDTGDIPPRCPQTGSLLRPDVVWFGEMLPEEALDRATTIARNCDVFFSIGTSGLVQPAASLPYMAMQAGAMLVVINLDTPLYSSPQTYYLKGASGIILPALVQAVWPNS